MNILSYILIIITQKKSVTVMLAHFQVYNETIRDLLMPGKPLAVREDPAKGGVHQFTDTAQGKERGKGGLTDCRIFFFSIF